MVKLPKRKKPSFPTDQKKFATLRILKEKDQNRSNINQLIHTVGLTTSQRAHYRIILNQMQSDGWVLIQESTEAKNVKIVSLTEKGSNIEDAVKQLLNEHPELKNETKVFRISNDDESGDDE